MQPKLTTASIQVATVGNKAPNSGQVKLEKPVGRQFPLTPHEWKVKRD